MDQSWRFPDNCWDFIHMVERACTVYQFVKERREGVLKLLTNNDYYQASRDELGITYDVVKKEMRKALVNADFMDHLLEEAENHRTDGDNHQGEKRNLRP